MVLVSWLRVSPKCGQRRSQPLQHRENQADTDTSDASRRDNRSRYAEQEDERIDT